MRLQSAASLLGIGCLALMLSGCAVRIADFTILSNRNVNLDQINLDELPQTRGVVGEDKALVLFIIPTGQPTIQGAVDDALSKADGDVMVDAVLTATSWWFLIGETGYEIKGTVVKTRGGGE